MQVLGHLNTNTHQWPVPQPGCVPWLNGCKGKYRSRNECKFSLHATQQWPVHVRYNAGCQLRPAYLVKRPSVGDQLAPY